MSEYSETLETSEDGRYRVRLLLDPYPDEPYDDGASPLLRIDGRNSGHVMKGSRPAGADEYVENAIAHWGTTPSDSDWHLFEKYLRAFHGVTVIKTWYSGSYWYVTYDPAAWRAWAGAPEGSADMSEYRAWCEGDVWYWVVEENVTWHRDGDPDETMETWETVDSCGGYYGSDGANGAYLNQCAREALLDAQVSGHGGVFGPLPADVPDDIDTAATASLSTYRELASAVRAQTGPDPEMITSGSESYPATISRPPSRVSGHRVLAWAELTRRDGNYPGGIVLAVRDNDFRFGPEYVTWDAYTKDGGETWAACDGHYFVHHDEAWGDFTRRCAETRLATI